MEAGLHWAKAIGRVEGANEGVFVFYKKTLKEKQQ